MEANPSGSGAEFPSVHPLAPPTLPGPVVRGSAPGRTTTIVGLVATAAVVVGAIGIAWNLFMAFSIFLAVGVQRGGSAYTPSGWTMAIAPAFGLLLASALIVTGIGLHGRRSWAVTVGYAWGGVRLAATLAKLLFWVATPFWSSGPVPNVTFLLAMAVGSLIWGGALPAGYIVFMTRPEARADVRAWRRRGGPSG